MITIYNPPISINKLYQGRRFLTAEGKRTKELMAWEVKAQWKGKPLTKDIQIDVTFYFKDKRGLDIDGGLKGLLDCISGICWTDDRYITDMNVHKRIDKRNPRIELQILGS